MYELERTFEPGTAGRKRLCLLGSRFQLEVTARHPRAGYQVDRQGVPDGDRFGQFTGAVKSYRRGSPAGAELCGTADTSPLPELNADAT